MKISGERLREMIKEEVEKFLKEEPIESNPNYGHDEDKSETPTPEDQPLREGEQVEEGKEYEKVVKGIEKSVEAGKTPKTFVDKKTGEKEKTEPHAIAKAMVKKGQISK